MVSFTLLRRKSSIAEAEADWDEKMRREKITWETPPSSPTVDNSVPSPPTKEESPLRTPTSQHRPTVVRDDSRGKATAAARESTPPPPLPKKEVSPGKASPARSPTQSAELRKAVEKRAAMLAAASLPTTPSQTTTKKKPPPPPPRSPQRQGTPPTIEETPQTTTTTTKPPPPPPPPPPPRSPQQEGTPPTRKHKRPTGTRVAALVDSWENMWRDAERANEEEQKIQTADETAIEAFFARKRNELKDASVLPPTFANVAGDPSYIDVLVSCAANCMVSYCVLHDDDAAAKKTWVTVDAPARVRIDDYGRYAVVAKAISEEKAESKLASAVFWLSPPARIEHALYVKPLRWIPEDAAHRAVGDVKLVCAECHVPLRAADATRSLQSRAAAATALRGFYAGEDDTPRFALCWQCALENAGRWTKLATTKGASSSSSGLDDVTTSPGGPVPPPRDDRRALSVEVDAGAKRLWLSEPIAFFGNRADVKPESFPMLSLLAGTVRRHPGMCIRLEGHTNSCCGLECDGSRACPNDTCARFFGHCGGAVGFSTDRAAAVRDWLLTHGDLPPRAADRLVAVGLGGSRRLVPDTEGPDNFKNRRVEAHIVPFL